MKKIVILSTALSSAFLLANCGPAYSSGAQAPASKPYLEGYQTQPTKEEVGYWDGDGVEGAAKIKLNIAQQKAYFYKGNQLVGQSPISSGDSTHKTPKGTFKVTQKSPDHRSSLYGVIKDNTTGEIIIADADSRINKPKAGQSYEGADMKHFLRFNGAIGMHKGHLPGYPASHGCVRLPGHMAKIFFENSKYGTPVIVE